MELPSLNPKLPKALDMPSIPLEPPTAEMPVFPPIVIPPSNLVAPKGVEGREKEEEVQTEQPKAPTLQQPQTQNLPDTSDPINPDPKAEAWAAKNSWFGTDRAMTYTAFEIHKDLTEKEGFDPKSDEYYAEVDKRIRVDFPHKFGTSDNKQSAAPVQTVASANRSVKPGRKTVRLTSSQVAIAKKLGVPLEEYAKQLKNTEGA